MHRMIPKKSVCLTLFAAAVLAIQAGLPQVQAQPPRVVHADVDYEASGFVTPAGMLPPSMYHGSVMPVGYAEPNMTGYGGPMAYGGDVGYTDMMYGDAAYGDCDATVGCDGPGGGQCGCASCQLLGTGGLLGKLGSARHGCGGCGYEGCSSCGGLTNMRHFCLFCQGDGCSACQMFGRGYLMGLLSALTPHQDAGRKALRWYDVSAEAVFLGHNSGGSNGVVTTLGTAGAPVLSMRAADDDSLDAGVRISAAMIFGPGSNLEFTYMGGHQWKANASASDPAAGLFSFISDFGTDVITGFDDTDQSHTQSLATSSELHSFELNYRRRTMGPYGRFQGSWLIGLRHIRYEDALVYTTIGRENNTSTADTLRYFSSNDRNNNRLFGPQAGFDVWYNMVPGINLGFGAKGAWMQNDIDRRSVLSANSFGTGATPGTIAINDGKDKSTVMGELEATIVYRLTHSWTVRSSYYLIGIDDIAFGSVDRDTVRSTAGAVAPQKPRYDFDRLTIQGVSIGAEYIW